MAEEGGGDPWTGGRHFAWRARALVLFALGSLALVAGLLFRSSGAILLATPLLLAPISAWLLLPRGTTKVLLRGSTEERGRGLLFSLELEATPPLPPGALEVAIVTPEGTDAPEGTQRRLLLQGQKVPPAQFYLLPQRPLFAKLATPEVRWRDPLGMGELQLPTRAEGLTVEKYPPEVRSIPRLAFQRTTILPGEVRSRQRAPAGDFSAIRAYVPGDSRHQINWWATARQGELMSNERLAERSGELVIVVDARPQGLPGSDDAHLLGVERAAALGLVRSFLREKTRVGVSVFGEFAECLPLGSGRLHAYRAERLLEKAVLAPVVAPVERLTVALRRYYRSGTPVLFLTPMVDDDTVAAGYHLRRRGFPCLLLTPSPTTLEKERLNMSTPDGEYAFRLLKLERRRRLRQGWESAPVVEWEDFTSLAALISFLRRPPVAARGGVG